MLVTSERHARDVWSKFLKVADWAAIDTETVAAPGYNVKKDALTIGRARIVIWSACYKGEAYSFPTNYLDPSYPTIYDWLRIPEFREFAAKKRTVFHNWNYDGLVFHYSDKTLKFKKWYCTLIGCFLANPAIDKSLKDRAPLYGRHLLKTGVIDFKKIGDIDVYAEDDVVQTDECYQMQRFGKVTRPKKIEWLDAKGGTTRIRNPMPTGTIKAINEHLPKFEKLFYRLHEDPYLRATMRAEIMGFPFNVKRVRRIRKKIDKRKDKVLKRIYRRAGRVVKMSSNPDKVKMLTELKINTPYRTKKGGISIANDALVKMQMHRTDPIIDDMQLWSAYNKLSNYSDPKKGLEWYVNPDGRIHASAKTLGARTGRGSSSNPNLQQIPSKKDLFGFKECFIAPEGYVIICLDYSQLELRVMAILAQEWRMAEILNDPNRDIHGETASQFSVDRDPVAKQINFLLQYAGTAWALAEKLTVEGHPTLPEQAQVWVNLYEKYRPKVIEYRQQLLRDHERNGFVTLLTGRRRWIENVRWNNPRDRHRAETQLSNNVVQGSGQDLLKASVIRSDFRCVNPDSEILRHNDVLEMKKSHRLLLKDYARKTEKIRRTLKLGDTRFALQVHDEVLYFCKKEAAEECGHLIGDTMTWRHYFPASVPYNVKLAAEGGIGNTWAEAKGKTPLHKIHAGLN